VLLHLNCVNVLPTPLPFTEQAKTHEEEEKKENEEEASTTYHH
jgi:hypothetical protein